MQKLLISMNAIGYLRAILKMYQKCWLVKKNGIRWRVNRVRLSKATTNKMEHLTFFCKDDGHPLVWTKVYDDGDILEYE